MSSCPRCGSRLDGHQQASSLVVRCGACGWEVAATHPRALDDRLHELVVAGPLPARQIARVAVISGRSARSLRDELAAGEAIVATGLRDELSDLHRELLQVPVKAMLRLFSR